MELKGYLSRSDSWKALILFLLPRQPFPFMIDPDSGSRGNCFLDIWTLFPPSSTSRLLSTEKKTEEK